MRLRTVAVVSLIMTLASVASAEQKVAVANAVKILTDSQETKDFNVSITDEQKRLTAEDEQRNASLTALQQKKEQLRPDSPQFTEVNNQIVEERNKSQTMKQQALMELARKFREHTKRMHGKIDIVLGKIAKEKGFDLVLADQKPEISDAQLEQMNPQMIVQALFTRTVLYRVDGVDITQDAIAALDQDYQSSKSAK